MFSFILEDHKKVLIKEYRIRIFTVLFFGMFFVLLASSIALLPANFISKVKLTDVRGNESNIKDEETQASILEEKIKRVNFLAFKLKSDPQIVLLKDKISAIVSNKDNVIINSFKFERVVSDGSLKISVSGIAPKRENLISFSKYLESVGFSKVDVPISGLAKNENIPFSISFTDK